MNDVTVISSGNKILNIPLKGNEEFMQRILSWKYKDAKVTKLSEVLILTGDLENQVREVFNATDRFYSIYKSDDYIVVDIQDGNWKYAHLASNMLMYDVFGLALEKEEITNMDGSDCYSAVHYYKIKAA